MCRVISRSQLVVLNLSVFVCGLLHFMIDVMSHRPGDFCKGWQRAVIQLTGQVHVCQVAMTPPQNRALHVFRRARSISNQRH